MDDMDKLARRRGPSEGPEDPTPVTGTNGTLGVSDQVAIWQQVLSFPAMLGTLLVTIIYVLKRSFEVDADFWWHLKVGEGILTTHHWPTSDPYSFTVAGQPWMSCEWLGDVLFASVERIGGLRGLELLLIVLSAAVMVAIYTLATLRSGNSKAAFVTSLAMLVMIVPVLTMRPQMLGYLFLVVTLIVLERFRQGRRGALWLLPPLFLVWINTHGSWVLGLLTILVYWIAGLKEFHIGGLQTRLWTPADRLRLSVVFLLSLAVLPITPYGTKLAAYPFQVASSLPVNIANINEWQPMPTNLPGGKVFLVLVLGLFALQIALELTWLLEESVLLFFGTLMAFLHVRFILVFVPFFAPLFATVLARWVPGYERKKDQHVVNAVLMVCMIGAMVRYFPSAAKIQETINSGSPVAAVEYIRKNPVAGPLFNTYGFGGYLIWARGPERKVFIDGRGEVYEHGGVFSDYLHIMLLKPGAIAVLNNYGIQACLLGRNEPLASILAAVPGWKRVYVDQTASIFVRQSSLGTASTIAMSARPSRSEADRNTLLSRLRR